MERKSAKGTGRKMKILEVKNIIKKYEDLVAVNGISFYVEKGEIFGLVGPNGAGKSTTMNMISGLLVPEEGRISFENGMNFKKWHENIACAIAHHPKLIIMDEPTVGIDPQSRNYILEGIKKLKKAGTTVIYTSHYMEEVEEICDRILIVDRGNIVEGGSIKEIKERYKKEETLPSLEVIFLLVTGKELRD